MANPEICSQAERFLYDLHNREAMGQLHGSVAGVSSRTEVPAQWHTQKDTRHAMLSLQLDDSVTIAKQFPKEDKSTGWRRLLEPKTDRLEPDSPFLRTMVLDKEEGVPMLSVQPKGKQKGCAGCNRKIKDRYLLKALDKYWHEDCLKCACCDCRLGEVGSTLYTKANLILCRRDYLRLFGTTGNCAACSKLIPAFEMVMRARDNVYHLDCFACQLCNQRFCVGDKFFLKNNMILCQMDYEEGQLNGSFETQVQ
ncbi:hypothetical protein SKAU_G00348160 [Synaphobranchus kaupii]|uniref:LIM zinc-binding domain-containing protein n=1 Tax=Synaphobranchus kaupii TaxID=118154 RepID=A0A9Q1IFR7_SYNKA|nr:hypothetical protein SKAU_G00348160 [Synaphobranchus kaupii]